MRRFVKIVAAVLAGCAALASAGATANAQEIQLTGPLAGAPAVHEMRLHRDGRFEVSLGSSFTLLDQYERTIMPGGTLTYHVFDWLGFGVFGGYGFQYETGLGSELEAIAGTGGNGGYNCANRPSIKACQLTAVSLVPNAPGKTLGNSQFGHIGWMVAPQVVGVPFRGKISFFSLFFIDTDIDFFLGPAFIGVKERHDCGQETDGTVVASTAAGGGPCSSLNSFQLASRTAITVTGGLGLNFYPSSPTTNFFGVGVDFRVFPFSWNTSGFDNHGGGTNKDFPDTFVNSADREFHFNTMLTVNLKFAFPVSIKTNK
jgi:hypothetical protein